MTPNATWWFVSTRPSFETKAPVAPPTFTTAFIGARVRSARSAGLPWNPAARNWVARSGSCEGIHMPSSARAVAANSSTVANRVLRVGRRRVGLRRMRGGCPVGTGPASIIAALFRTIPGLDDMTMMKALVKREAGKGIWMEQVPVPVPGPNEVLIRLEKTAICGTDLHIYLWDDWSQRTIKPGLVIGHEFVGRIVDLGPGVTGYKLGQRVSAEGHIVCGHCRNCRAGRQHLCPNTVGIGVNRDGAFAEFIVMPASNLWPIPDQIPSELAAFFDPYGNAAHCALEFDVVGEDVLITGAGPIGIIAAGICKHIGARNVVVTDVNDYRLKLAADMGATRVG